MKFTSQSLKPDLKPQNEDFFFEIETPRGHFFAALDFDRHDFANLNTNLEAKLETIVGSFVTLQQFSADLFLGFIAKEINNFLHSLGQHSGEQELLCSASLCLVDGNRLSHFTWGDASIVLISQNQMLPLAGIEAAEFDQSEQPIRQLGQREQESPLIDQVQHFTLKEGDVVLIMTSGIASEFEGQMLLDQVLSLGSLEPKIICETLMEASETSQEDRTLLVIGGPYERYADPVLADLSGAVASSEQRLNALNEGVEIAGGGALTTNMAVDEDRLFELDRKLENLSVVLGNKADTAELLGLQSEVLKLGVLAKERSAAGENRDRDSFPTRAVPEAVARSSSGWRPVMWVALLLVVGIAGGFIGGWIHASRMEKVAEAWTVKTSGNQIVISRLNSEASPSIVTINTTQSLQATGEQTFSSFADVKQYIDSITPPEVPAKVEQVEPEAQTADQSQPKPSPSTLTKKSKAAEIVTSIAFRQGDSLKTLAQRYNVASAKLIALNPKITRWSLVKAGQKVVVPAGPVNSRTVSQQPEQSSDRRPTNTATRKVTVEAGDTLDKLANRHKLSPSRLKELNPQITNWSRIQAGQKVLVPSAARG
jgi:LysM repeat protein